MIKLFRVQSGGTSAKLPDTRKPRWFQQLLQEDLSYSARCTKYERWQSLVYASLNCWHKQKEENHRWKTDIPDILYLLLVEVVAACRDCREEPFVINLLVDRESGAIVQIGNAAPKFRGRKTTYPKRYSLRPNLAMVNVCYFFLPLDGATTIMHSAIRLDHYRSHLP